MRIFGAIGLGLTIIVLQVLAPHIWSGLEGTIVQFFDLAQVMMAHAETIMSRGLSGF